VITAIAYLGRAILINMMEKDQHLEWSNLSRDLP